MTVSTTNLPALSTQVGGALAVVLNDASNRISGKELSTVEVLSVTRLVDSMPELNTEPRVELLLQMVSQYGIEVSPQLRQLLDLYDVETVFLAIAFIRESCSDVDPRADGPKKDLSADQPLWLDTQVLKTCEIIEILRDLGETMMDFEDVAVHVEVLGSLQQATELDYDTIAALWRAHILGESPDVLTVEQEDYALVDESERGDEPDAE